MTSYHFFRSLKKLLCDNIRNVNSWRTNIIQENGDCDGAQHDPSDIVSYAITCFPNIGWAISPSCLRFINLTLRPNDLPKDQLALV